MLKSHFIDSDIHSLTSIQPSPFGQGPALTDTAELKDASIVPDGDSDRVSILSSDNKPGPARSQSLNSSIFNLTKSALGAGIVVLPKSTSLCGLLPAVTLIVFAGFSTLITLFLLSRLSVTGASDYIGLGKKSYGRKGEIVILVIQMVFLLAPMTAYVKFNGIFIHSFLQFLGMPTGTTFATSVEFFTILSSLALVFPLCLLRNLGKLSFASLLGLGCVLYIAALTVTDYVLTVPTLVPRPVIEMGRLNLAMLSAFNSFILSYVNHPSLLCILAEMNTPTYARRGMLISISQFVILLLYLLISIFGYLQFGTAIESYDNLLVTKETKAYAAGQFLFAVANIVTFPLVHFPARLSLDWSITQSVRRSPALAKKWQAMASYRHVLEAFFLVSLTTLLAVTFKSVLQIFDLFVPISGSFLVFIIPAVCFIQQRAVVDASRAELWAAYFSLVMGVLLFAVGTPIAMVNMIRQE